MIRSLALTGAVALALLLGACDDKAKVASAGPPPPPPQDDTSVHNGGVTTHLPARTDTESSGVEGSSTSIGAPPKGQTGLATAHGPPG